MKKPRAIFSFFLIICAASLTGWADGTPENSSEGQYSGSEDTQENLNYRVRMRELDRAYNDGEYTRTEYIRLKREIEERFGGKD